jgi:inorganic phosphate transporter, PiT family
VAAVVTGGIYAIVGFAKGATGRDACLCVAETKLVEPVHPTLPIAVVASRSECASYGLVPILTTRKLLDVGHYISAGAVGFARGVNDTPKLLALLIPVQVLSPQQGAILIAATMSIGGLLGARRVAETISHRVTSMNAEQGFAANVTTAVLVLFASHVGLPVSTTHVSSGSLFGLGAITGQARWHTILQIVTAWIVTLPCAALLAGMVWWIGGR